MLTFYEERELLRLSLIATHDNVSKTLALKNIHFQLVFQTANLHFPPFQVRYVWPVIQKYYSLPYYESGYKLTTLHDLQLTYIFGSFFISCRKSYFSIRRVKCLRSSCTIVARAFGSRCNYRARVINITSRSSYTNNYSTFAAKQRNPR